MGADAIRKAVARLGGTQRLRICREATLAKLPAFRLELDRVGASAGLPLGIA